MPDDHPNWATVLYKDVCNKIYQMRASKARGPDKIPIELLKLNPLWWGKILAPVFSQIRQENPPSLEAFYNRSSF